MGGGSFSSVIFSDTCMVVMNLIKYLGWVRLSLLEIGLAQVGASVGERVRCLGPLGRNIGQQLICTGPKELSSGTRVRSAVVAGMFDKKVQAVSGP